MISNILAVVITLLFFSLLILTFAGGIIWMLDQQRDTTQDDPSSIRPQEDPSSIALEEALSTEKNPGQEILKKVCMDCKVVLDPGSPNSKKTSHVLCLSCYHIRKEEIQNLTIAQN